MYIVHVYVCHYIAGGWSGVVGVGGRSLPYVGHPRRPQGAVRQADGADATGQVLHEIENMPS